MRSKSLKNQGMEYVDLYIYRMWEYRTPIYDVLESLNEIVKRERCDMLIFLTVLPVSLQRSTPCRTRKDFPDSYLLRDIII